MTPENRMTLQIARTSQFGDYMRTALIGQIAIAGLIGFGVEGIEFALGAAVLSVTLFGILAGGTALDDISALRSDMDEPTAGSHYGKVAHGRNLNALKIFSAVLLALVALGELYAIFA